MCLINSTISFNVVADASEIPKAEMTLILPSLLNGIEKELVEEAINQLDRPSQIVLSRLNRFSGLELND